MIFEMSVSTKAIVVENALHDVDQGVLHFELGYPLCVDLFNYICTVPP